MRRFAFCAKTMLTLLTLLAAAYAAGVPEKVLYSFTGEPDAQYPNGVIADKSGNLYGVVAGGQGNCFSSGCGFVYQLAPVAGGGWNKTNLYAFTGGNDGGYPSAKLATDAKGTLYGTTLEGGTGSCIALQRVGCGVVFQLSQDAQGKWQYTVIYNFGTSGANDGASPTGDLALGGDGNFYGTTTYGGDTVCGCGIVYQLKPGPNGQWTEKVIYRFVGGTDVAFSSSGVLVDGNGQIFGTGANGGGSANCTSGCGGVFELIPQPDGSYQEHILHVFVGGHDGSLSSGGLVADSKGNLFGTTIYGGGFLCNNRVATCGTVYELKKAGSGYQESVILRFNGPNGFWPYGALVVDNADNLYGLTQNGGGIPTLGVAFQLSNIGGKWKQTLLHIFGGAQGGQRDGMGPSSALTSDGKGGFFGTTYFGGSVGRGAVFQFLP